MSVMLYKDSCIWSYPMHHIFIVIHRGTLATNEPLDVKP